jgi:hypothetical protein
VTGKRRAPSTWTRARAKLTNTELRVATVDRTRASADLFWADGERTGEFWRGDAAQVAGHGVPSGSRAGSHEVPSRARPGRDVTVAGGPARRDALAVPGDTAWADETQVIPAVPNDETRELGGLPLRDLGPAGGRTRGRDAVSAARRDELAATRQDGAAGTTPETAVEQRDVAGGQRGARDERAARGNRDSGATRAAADAGDTGGTRAAAQDHDAGGTRAAAQDHDAGGTRAAAQDHHAGGTRAGVAARNRDSAPARADDVPRPLYARALLLRNLDPGPVMCFLFFEGALATGAALALADLVNWWAVVVLPATIAVVVKLNDLVAGSAGRRALGGPVAAAGPDWPDRRQAPRSGDPVKEAHLEWRRGLRSDLRSVGTTGEPDDFPHRGRPVELPRDW